jgi:hypothetical protein
MGFDHMDLPGRSDRGRHPHGVRRIVAADFQHGVSLIQQAAEQVGFVLGPFAIDFERAGGGIASDDGGDAVSGGEQ